jgi:hypothetical protein
VFEGKSEEEFDIGQRESMLVSTLQIEVHVLLTVEGQRESMLVSTLQIEVHVLLTVAL